MATQAFRRGGPSSPELASSSWSEASILGCCLKWFASLSLMPWLSVKCRLPSGPRSLKLPPRFSPKPHPMSRTNLAERRGCSPTPDLPPTPPPRALVSLRVAGSHSRAAVRGRGQAARLPAHAHVPVPQTPPHGPQSAPCPFPSSTHACPAAGPVSLLRGLDETLKPLSENKTVPHGPSAGVCDLPFPCSL